MSSIDIGTFTVTQRTYLRDDSGRFVSEVEAGAARSAWELAEDTANLARVFAPIDKGRLVGSIRPFMTGATSGAAVAGGPGAEHAAAQEKGAVPHSIGAPGQLLWNPEKMFAAVGPVQHPGNRAVRYMQRAGEAVAALSPAILRRNMPGG